MASIKSDNGGEGGKVSALPWKDVESRFFTQLTIKPDRWDKLFPYRLIVIDSQTNTIVGPGTGNLDITVNGDPSRSAIEFTPIDEQWIFTLPITPQQLSITDTFAINTTATLLGVVEEHSGVRFKSITMQGTMGVWSHRVNLQAPAADPAPFGDALKSAFGGTIDSAENALEQMKRTMRALSAGHPAAPPVTEKPTEASQNHPGETSTGYYQALALQQFLEQYAEAKKDPKKALWRLVLDIPKQNQSFVVTPMAFSWSQSVSKPMEVNYSMQLKAWRRIDLNVKENTAGSVQVFTPSLLQRAISTIAQARKVLATIVDLVGAVRSDVGNIFEILRQTSLFTKDLVGAVLTAADLPFQLQRDADAAVEDFFKNMSTADLLRYAAADPSIANALVAFRLEWSRTEGLNSITVRADGLDGPEKTKTEEPKKKTNLVSKILDSPEKNYTLMEIVDINSLNLNSSQQQLADDSKEEARRITIDDLKGFRETIHQLSIQLSNNFGAGHSFYSKVYSKPEPSKRIQEMTLDEYEILQSLYDVIQVYDTLTATSQIDDSKKQSNMDFVAGLASESGSVFNNTQAKTLAPVPFGLTVEAIAARYLGDAQRWLEIVTLNNLRSPYVDENGFRLNLLSNASGRQATVTGNDDLFVGQRILLRSTSQSEISRRILNIDKLSAVSYLLTFDGEASLDNFTKNDGAYLQAYLPGTVNSQQKIFIPSNVPVKNDARIINPSSTLSDPLIGISKVDWLLSDSGDVAVNSYGDFRLSAGMTNLIQAIKIKIGTQKGKMLTHPNFGLGLAPGQSTADVNVKSIFDEINSLIKQDSRFSGLDNLQVTLEGTTMTINMVVRLVGNNGVFPVAFDM